jgi:hypothetical protein
VQKWIIGRTLVSNFRWSLASYGIKENGCSIFLYVVEPRESRSTRSPSVPSESPSGTLASLEECDLYGARFAIS